MSQFLYGRYGPYKPKTPADKAKAHRQAAARQQAQQQRLDWLVQHRTCLNGCGKPVAFFDEIHYALRYSGCCSEACKIMAAGRQALTVSNQSTHSNPLTKPMTIDLAAIKHEAQEAIGHLREILEWIDRDPAADPSDLARPLQRAAASIAAAEEAMQSLPSHENRLQDAGDDCVAGM